MYLLSVFTLFNYFLIFFGHEIIRVRVIFLSDRCTGTYVYLFSYFKFWAVNRTRLQKIFRAPRPVGETLNSQDEGGGKQ